MIAGVSASEVAAVASAVSAVVAVSIAASAERRSRRAHERGVAAEERSAQVAVAQVYLTLRQNFDAIFARLGEIEPLPAAIEEFAVSAETKNALVAYWHNAYSEWYVPTHLAPDAVGDLWESTFRPAVRSGYGRPALRMAFDALAADERSGFGAYAQPFIQVVRSME